MAVKEMTMKFLNRVMKSLNRIIIGLSICCALFQVGYSTTMKSYTLSRLGQVSDMIVLAKVLEVQTARIKGRIFTFSTIDILRTLQDKAPSSKVRLIVRTLGGTIDDLTQYVAGVPVLQVGEEALFFLRCSGQVVGSGQVIGADQVIHGNKTRLCDLVGFGQGLWRATDVDVEGNSLFIPSLEGMTLVGSDHSVQQVGQTLNHIKQVLQKEVSTSPYRIESSTLGESNTFGEPNTTGVSNTSGESQ